MRQQAILWASVNPNLFHHMALLNHNALREERQNQECYDQDTDTSVNIIVEHEADI